MGSKGRRRGFPGAFPGRHARQASGGSHCDRIPRTDNQLPRACHGQGYIRRSMQEGRQRAQRAYEHILELPGATEAQSFFEEECPGDRLMLKPHQQEQARPSTGVGGLRLPSAEAKSASTSVGSRVGSLIEVTVDLASPLGDRVERWLP